MSSDTSARRPLKSRGTTWAQSLSRVLLKLGFRPNTVSLLSIVCAGAGGAAMFWVTRTESSWPFWLIAATGIQMRLLCNLMDGMLAVEGGLKSTTGELYNEIPDRIADALILVPLGYAGGTPLTIALGWAVACGAVLTAYLRALGAALTHQHDFCGPMAKPQRMFVTTVCCLGMMTLALLDVRWPLILWTLVVIGLGIGITSWRRVRHLASRLNQTSPS